MDYYGHDLAKQVQQQGLPVTDLHIRSPKIRGYSSFFDFILWTLVRPMNSMFLVGNDVDYIRHYVNALALLMSRPESFAEVIRASAERASKSKQTVSVNSIIELGTRKLTGVQLYTIDMKKLLAVVGQEHSKWDEIFSKDIVNAANQGKHYFVIENINEIFKLSNREKWHYQALSMFFATRGKVKITFLAPLSWADYANDIERGIFPRLIQHRTPILFSPRPANLPPSPDAKFAPDPKFAFRD